MSRTAHWLYIKDITTAVQDKTALAVLPELADADWNKSPRPGMELLEYETVSVRDFLVKYWVLWKESSCSMFLETKTYIGNY